MSQRIQSKLQNNLMSLTFASMLATTIAAWGLTQQRTDRATSKSGGHSQTFKNPQEEAVRNF